MKKTWGVIAVAAVFLFSVTLCGAAFKQDAADDGAPAGLESAVSAKEEVTLPFEDPFDPLTMPPEESTVDDTDPGGGTEPTDYTDPTDWTDPTDYTDPTDWTDPTDYTDITVTIEEPTDDWTKPPEETSDGEITLDPTEDGSYTWTAEYDGGENGEVSALAGGETLYKGEVIPQTGASPAGGIAVFAALSLAAAAAFVCRKKR